MLHLESQVQRIRFVKELRYDPEACNRGLRGTTTRDKSFSSVVITPEAMSDRPGGYKAAPLQAFGPLYPQRVCNPSAFLPHPTMGRSRKFQTTGRSLAPLQALGLRSARVVSEDEDDLRRYTLVLRPTCQRFGRPITFSLPTPLAPSLGAPTLAPPHQQLRRQRSGSYNGNRSDTPAGNKDYIRRDAG
jgi:hypothetical protein